MVMSRRLSVKDSWAVGERGWGLENACESEVGAGRQGRAGWGRTCVRVGGTGPGLRHEQTALCQGAACGKGAESSFSISLPPTVPPLWPSVPHRFLNLPSICCISLRCCISAFLEINCVLICLSLTLLLKQLQSPTSDPSATNHTHTPTPPPPPSPLLTAPRAQVGVFSCISSEGSLKDQFISEVHHCLLLALLPRACCALGNRRYRHDKQSNTCRSFHCSHARNRVCMSMDAQLAPSAYREALLVSITAFCLEGRDLSSSEEPLLRSGNDLAYPRGRRRAGVGCSIYTSISFSIY